LISLLHLFVHFFQYLQRVECIRSIGRGWGKVRFQCNGLVNKSVHLFAENTELINPAYEYFLADVGAFESAVIVGG
jgi:hypothetical protein